MSGNEFRALPDGLLDTPSYFLTSLDLSDNAIVGTLSPNVSQLSTLRSLSIADNVMEGTVPVELGWLTDLTTLNVSGNAFTGFGQSVLESLQSLV